VGKEIKRFDSQSQIYLILLLIGGDKSHTTSRHRKGKGDLEKIKKIREMETSKFDIADYLDSNEMIAEYLNTVLEEGNDADMITAIGHIAKAIGMTKIAEETGMSRSSLYKALSDGAKPQFETIMKVLKAIGGQIRVTPVSA
jgi:probable addiction module antidote protein